MSQPHRKVYLGDGVYVEFDGHGLVLTTENGIEATNAIYLEPAVYSALTQYVESLLVPVVTTKQEADD